MFTAQVQETPKARVVKLAGVLDDTVDLGSLLGPLPKVLLVDCGGITRVNSIGIKKWLEYFAQPKALHSQIVYFDCSPAIVEQFNMLVNFGGSGRVRSLQVPFSCSSCDNRFLETHMTEALAAAKYQLADRKCPKCQAPAFFDDVAEEYFSFLLAPK